MPFNQVGISSELWQLFTLEVEFEIMVCEWIDLLRVKSMCCYEVFWLNCVVFSEFEECEYVLVAVDP